MGLQTRAVWEYKTEVLTTMVGRDKLRMGDLEDKLKKYGRDGWELVTLTLTCVVAATGTC